MGRGEKKKGHKGHKGRKGRPPARAKALLESEGFQVEEKTFQSRRIQISGSGEPFFWRNSFIPRRNAAGSIAGYR